MNIWDVDPNDDELDQGSLDDSLGAIEAHDEGDELVLARTGRDGRAGSTEMLRFNRVERLLRIFPRVTRGGRYEDQFGQITELQVEAPLWNPDGHSAVSDRYGLLHVVGLPLGFSTVYEFGLGIKRDYRALIDEIEERTLCTIVRFIVSGVEGVEQGGASFAISRNRFEDYRAMVDRSRSRGRTAVRRVIEAECQNAVADLFGLDHVEPKFGRNPVIRSLTEEVSTGYVMDAADRAVLVDELARAAPKVAQESPGRFGRLCADLELVSLEVLIDGFEKGLGGRHAGDEDHWQWFFNTNQFALQQVFSAPIVVARQLAHVRGEDVAGRGSRIADFLCANTVTRTAVVVEIKTPATVLMDTRAYRGRGSAAVFPPHRDLSGSVSQVQSQMASVPRDLAQRLGSTPELDLDPWNDVRGGVIAGRVSSIPDQARESFLRYRAGLATVTVLGYDEVLDRLKALLAVLKTPPHSDEDSGTAVAGAPRQV